MSESPAREDEVRAKKLRTELAVLALNRFVDLHEACTLPEINRIAESLTNTGSLLFRRLEENLQRIPDLSVRRALWCVIAEESTLLQVQFAALVPIAQTYLEGERIRRISDSG